MRRGAPAGDEARRGVAECCSGELSTTRALVRWLWWDAVDTVLRSE